LKQPLANKNQDFISKRSLSP